MKNYLNTLPHLVFSFQELENFTFQVLNGAGDVFDIIKAVDKASRPDFDSMTTEELDLYVKQNSHCSALIKVNGSPILIIIHMSCV